MVHFVIISQFRKDKEAKRSWWSQIESSGAERLLNYTMEGGLILTKMIWAS